MAFKTMKYVRIFLINWKIERFENGYTLLLYIVCAALSMESNFLIYLQIIQLCIMHTLESVSRFVTYSIECFQI